MERTEEAMFVYLPSCNFTAACPDASRKIQAYLARKPGVRVAGCCRAEVRRLEPQDTAITVCMTCAAIVEEAAPQAEQISLWSYLFSDEAFPWPDFHGEPMTLQDCWRARHRPELHRAVRRCMERMNLTVVELEEREAAAQFDGVWRYNPVAARNLAIAPDYFGQVRDHGIELLPPEEQARRMVDWARRYETKRVATYCNACLRGVRMGGADGVHLLELAVQALPEAE